MSQVSDPSVQHLDGRARWLGLAVLALTQLVIVVDMTIVNVALPSMAADLRISAADRQWVITAYTLTFAGLLLLGGRIADYTGRRRALLIGLVGFAVASAVGGAATSLQTLLIARAAQGAFGAVLAPSSLALVSTTFTAPGERAKAFGVFGAVVAAGSPIGLVLSGVLTTLLSWHWVLYVNVPLAAVAALGALRFLRESRVETRTAYDVPGAVLSTAGLVAIVYGCARAAQTGWSAPGSVGLLVGGLVLMLAFVVVEAHRRSPLLPLTVVRHRCRAGAYLVVALMMAGPFGAYLFISFFLQRVAEYSALLTGLAFLPLTGGVMLAAAISSQRLTGIAPRFVMGFGLLLGAAGLGLLSRLAIDSAYLTNVLPSLVMIGLGMGLVIPHALNLATLGVEPREAGVASAMFNVSQQTGASLTTALLNTAAAGATVSYLTTHGQTALATIQAQVQGYNAATVWGSAILLAGAIAALTLINAPSGDAGPANVGAEATARS